MDLGFLTKVLAGQGGGSSPMSMLLPMLLGAKGSGSKPAGNSDLAGILSELLGQKREDQGSFPPLFGDEEAGDGSLKNPLLNIVGNLMPGMQKTKENPQKTIEYPYELQYNHPYREEK